MKKGDAIVTFFRKESVELSTKLCDGYELRPGDPSTNISVQEVKDVIKLFFLYTSSQHILSDTKRHVYFNIKLSIKIFKSLGCVSREERIQ